jgi:hypothetical protein
MSRQLLTILIATLGLLSSRPTLAFDTGSHFDLIENALMAEGFGRDPIRVVQVSSFHTDFYDNSGEVPQSGHVANDTWTHLLGNVFTLSEDWPDSVMRAADVLHFDRVKSTVAVDNEWKRLATTTRSALLARARSHDLEGMLVIMGISLHEVQDFYAHSNWVEPQPGKGEATRFDGPGWSTGGLTPDQVSRFGRYPTWWDLPEDVRKVATIYTLSQTRGHGDWDSDRGACLCTALNKDWSGRPLYRDAYVTAYFATRQWIDAMQSWVHDPGLWNDLRAFRTTQSEDLARDWEGAIRLSRYTGHWSGNWDKGMSKSDLVAYGTRHYFAGGVRRYRKLWELNVNRVAARLGSADAGPAVAAITSSKPIQDKEQFVSLKIEKIAQIDDIDQDAIVENEADWYVDANVAGLEFHSGVINGANSYGFPSPHSGFQFLRAVPSSALFDEMVCTMKIELATGSGDGAGTDADVWVRFNDDTRIEIPYSNEFDDFETGRRDSYVLNPGDGLRVRDIKYIQIERDNDSDHSAWELAGVNLWVNGRKIYSSGDMNVWLKRGATSWRAPSFHATAPKTPRIPVRIQLWDDDNIYSGDEHADINPARKSRDLRILYDRTDASFQGDANGHSHGSSRGDPGSWNLADSGQVQDRARKDPDPYRAEIEFEMETIPTAPEVAQ